MPVRREKLHRLPRESYRGNVTAAFTTCIVNSQSPFVDQPIVNACISILQVSAQEQDCVIPIYCFMPDHLHVIVHGQDKKSDVRAVMTIFKQRSGYWFGQHQPDVKWQKDFYDHIIWREDDLGAQVRYVAGNPVRKGLVKDWREYPYTGAIGIALEAMINSTITL